MTKRKSDYELIEQAVRAYWNEKESDRLMATVPQWIPVSEKLPKKSGFYVCTVNKAFPTIKLVTFELIKDDYRWILENGTEVFPIFVSAWMPLPKPYKGGEEE